MSALSTILYFITWIWFIVTAFMLSKVDFREHRLPNLLVFSAYLGGLVGFALLASTRGDFPILVYAMAGSLVTVLAYLIIHLLGGMGMGDVKYAAVVGLYLGSLGWTYLYIGLLISFAGAAIWVIPTMFTNKKTRNVPFGPFMALGVLVSGVIALGVSAAA